MPKILFEYAMRGKLPTGNWPGPQWRAAMQHLRGIVGPATSYENFIDTVNSPEFKTLLKP